MNPMKKPKFTEEQIVFALKQYKQGVLVEDICRKLGIAQSTFYKWQKEYDGLSSQELRELRMLMLEYGFC